MKQCFDFFHETNINRLFFGVTKRYELCVSFNCSVIYFSFYFLVIFLKDFLYHCYLPLFLIFEPWTFNRYTLWKKRKVNKNEQGKKVLACVYVFFFTVVLQFFLLIIMVVWNIKWTIIYQIIFRGGISWANVFFEFPFVFKINRKYFFRMWRKVDTSFPYFVYCTEEPI